ncbi:NAD(P)-binding domain-containing protein [soil metagenome]
MKIGIIGAGQIGGTLVRRFRQLGHEVTVSNSRSPETLTDLANETGATAMWAKDAAADADLVIVSIPQKNVPDLAEGIVDARKPGAPVIETNNYYPQQRDGELAAIEDGQLESAWVAEQIGAPVYKVFNGIWWKHLLESGKPRSAPNRIALPIAGENGPGRELVHTIVDELGFEPVDAGPISESWRRQPGTPVYGKDFDADNTRKALAEASRERTAEWSARTA